jgi:hypothetical protein
MAKTVGLTERWAETRIRLSGTQLLLHLRSNRISAMGAYDWIGSIVGHLL